MSITKIIGVYHSLGSMDTPNGIATGDNYGFNEIDGEPVFRYSLSNIETFCNNTTVIRPNTISVGEISKIATIAGMELPVEAIDELFDIVDLIYSEQSIADTKDYSTHLSDNTYYKQDTLSINNDSSYTGRITYVGLSIVAEGITYACKIYINPDRFMLDYGILYSNVSILEPYYDSTVEDAEYDRIMSELRQMEMAKGYINIINFDTTRVEYDELGIETKRYQQTFDIFNHMYSGYNGLDEISKLYLIKQFLVTKYNSDSSYLGLHYPDIFNGLAINVYPMTMNVHNNEIVTPISVYDLKLESIGRLTIDEMEDGVQEIMTLEAINGKYDSEDSRSSINTLFRIPIMVVESNADTNADLPAPIKSRFPDFALQYTGKRLTGSNYEGLYLYLKLSLKLTLGIIPYAGFETDLMYDSTNIPESTQFEVKLTEGDDVVLPTVDTVSFNYLGVRYTVHSYNRRF